MDPMPPPPPPPPSAPPPPYGAEPLRTQSWFQRNKTWAIPVGCLGAVVVFGCCGVIGVAAFGFEKAASFVKSEKASVDQVHGEVTRLVSEDPRVIDVVGEPVQVGVAVTGYRNNNGVVRTSFRLTATGPKGQANGQGEAGRESSTAPWDIGPVVMTLEGEEVELVEGRFSEENAGEPWPTGEEEVPPSTPPQPGGPAPSGEAPRPPDGDPFQE